MSPERAGRLGGQRAFLAKKQRETDAAALAACGPPGPSAVAAAAPGPAGPASTTGWADEPAEGGRQPSAGGAKPTPKRRWEQRAAEEAAEAREGPAGEGGLYAGQEALLDLIRQEEAEDRLPEPGACPPRTGGPGRKRARLAAVAAETPAEARLGPVGAWGARRSRGGDQELVTALLESTKRNHAAKAVLQLCAALKAEQAAADAARREASRLRAEASRLRAEASRLREENATHGTALQAAQKAELEKAQLGILNARLTTSIKTCLAEKAQLGESNKELKHALQASFVVNSKVRNAAETYRSAYKVTDGKLRSCKKVIDRIAAGGAPRLDRRALSLPDGRGLTGRAALRSPTTPPGVQIV